MKPVPSDEFIDSLAQTLFEVWRTDQTGDVWRQLRSDEQEAWRRVARAVELAAWNAALKVMG